MRPNPYDGGGSLHECVECGARVASPGSGTCAECNGTLRNLSVPRDL
ncbi:MAG: rubrerythrin-like domain-containing protein [Halodesulfurarchaeum sp.]